MGRVECPAEEADQVGHVQSISQRVSFGKPEDAETDDLPGAGLMMMVAMDSSESTTGTAATAEITC
jgi:hypothetical protein